MSKQQETVFDQVLDGRIPCYKVYEDEQVLAFLDIRPLSYGHTLVIPKQRCAYLHDLDDSTSAALGRVLPRIARAVLAASGARAYNVLQNNGATAGQEVMHVHFHIIPRLGDSGLGIGWSAGKLRAAAATALVAKMQAALSS